MRLLGMAAFAVLLWTFVHGIGGAMWDFADSMPLWWESEDENDDKP